MIISIQDEAELETELTDADTYSTELEEKIAILEDFIMKASQPPVIQEAVSHTLESHPPLVASTAAQMPETEVVNKPVHPVTSASECASTNISNLPERVSAGNNNLPIKLANKFTPARDSTFTFSRLPKLTLPKFNGSPYNGTGTHFQLEWTLTLI